MFRKLCDHIGYYASLVLILAFGFLLVFMASPNKQLQMVAIILTTFSYCTWGILHHFINHDLHTKIVVEYVLVGVLGLTMVIFIL